MSENKYAAHSLEILKEEKERLELIIVEFSREKRALYEKKVSATYVLDQINGEIELRNIK